jgi:hypothetical protein
MEFLVLGVSTIPLVLRRKLANTILSQQVTKSNGILKQQLFSMSDLYIYRASVSHMKTQMSPQYYANVGNVSIPMGGDLYEEKKTLYENDFSNIRSLVPDKNLSWKFYPSGDYMGKKELISLKKCSEKLGVNLPLIQAHYVELWLGNHCNNLLLYQHNQTIHASESLEVLAKNIVKEESPFAYPCLFAGIAFALALAEY